MLKQAAIGTRFIALVIDHILTALVGGVVGILIGTEVGGLSFFLVEVAYQGYFLTEFEGQTPGKRYMGIRVIKTNGKPITWADAIMRVIGYHLNTLVLFLGWIWALFDTYSQGWHDKLAGTYVVKAPRRKGKR